MEEEPICNGEDSEEEEEEGDAPAEEEVKVRDEITLQFRENERGQYFHDLQRGH